MSDSPEFPPKGYVAVGEYAFAPPYVPTKLQLEQAEEFIFTHPNFEKLEETDRRRNVINLAIAAASTFMLPEQEGSSQLNLIPLIGGAVKMTIERHDGTPILTYNLLEDQ